MKNNFKFITGIFLLGVMFLSVSCGDEFTEEDALKAQQNVDLTIYVYDRSSVDQTSVAGATVTVNQGGKKMEVVTDSSGVAQFPDLAIGSYLYKVEATDFITVTDNDDIYTDNFRIGQFTQQVGLYSTSETNLATIKGNIMIDTDVTNLTKEAAAGVKVYFNVVGNLYTATTDENGYYEIQVPTNGANNSTYVGITYESFEADQTIALNKYADEAGYFPTVLPRIETIKTLFSADDDGEQNMEFYDENVRSLYAIADAAPADGETAVISSVYVNAKGEVTGINFNESGDYTGDADGIVNISIFSLDGGSGASIAVTLGDQTNLENAYYEYGTATTVITAGSGYPDDNYTLNKVSYRYPSFPNYVYVTPGSTSYINGDYGTGIYRPRQLD